jgi:hypothetical protein
MTEASNIQPNDIRAFANLPIEVPEALLSKHIGIATRDLTRATGLDAAPQDKAEIWGEALTVCALASVFPWLNTFALDGAAKVGRLEGSVDYRFLDAEDVEEKVSKLQSRFDELVAILAPDDADQETKGQVSTDGTWLAVI